MSLSSMIIILILFSLTALASATEMAIASINKFRLKVKVDAGDQVAIEIYDLVEDYDRTITTIVILNNFVNILLPTITTVFMVAALGEKYGVIVSTVLMSILILIFGEILPKIYGKEYPEQHLIKVYKIIKLLKMIFKPIVIIFMFFSKQAKKFISKRQTIIESDLEEELLVMIEESKENGQLAHAEEELIGNAIEFNETRVEEILQPRSSMIMLDVNSSNIEILEQLKIKKHSRIPIYENDQNNIIGILSSREFLVNYIEDNNFLIRDIIRPTIFTPDSLKISKLLPRLQKEHIYMAIVIDERATVQGLITTEDIIEEIVGEIWDEHDEVSYEYQKIKENEFEVSGEMSISDFNDLFNDVGDIISDTSEATIAGYLIEQAEHILDIGQQFNDDTFIYTVSSKIGNKIEQINIKIKKEKS